jgi:catechol 2,3-dioxygenase-like lactoylglutathione lyase family enzyme
MTTMAAKLLEAWGYQGDAMALPVDDVNTSAAYYVDKLGFEITDRAEGCVVLKRAGLQMAINENGGDPTQDEVAFLVDDVNQLHKELTKRKAEKLGEIKAATRDDGDYQVFFLAAPDGLCFWFGQKT